jgi:hypothetical protein
VQLFFHPAQHPVKRHECYQAQQSDKSGNSQKSGREKEQNRGAKPDWHGRRLAVLVPGRNVFFPPTAAAKR